MATQRVGLAVIVLGLVVSATGTAEATIVLYTDQAAFLAASGTTTLETFNTSPQFNTTGAFGPTAYNGFSLTGDGNGNNIGIHQNAVANSSDNNPIPASFVGQNFFGFGNEAGGAIGPLTINFAQPTTAFGFDWFNTDVSDQYQITFQPGGATFRGPPFTVAPSTAASTGFFGVVSDTALTSATISNQFNGGFISDEGFDNVRVGVTAATPEPSTLVSGGIAALLGIGYSWRRRKAKLAG